LWVRTRSRAGVALLLAVLLALAGFAAWQYGIPAYQRAQAVPAYSPSEDLALPSQVYDPPPYVASTDSVGPPGPVGLVFQGRSARDGLTGEVDDPWYAVSSRSGDYYRLEEPHLAQTPKLYVGPQGTQVAWAWPGGIERYDSVSGETQSYAVGGSAMSGALAWSPDSTRIAFGADPVRVLDVRTGKVTPLPLRLPADGTTTPAWTPDGDWVTAVTGDALDAVRVDSGRRRTLALEGDDTAAGEGGFTGADWNAGGELAGVHRQVRLSRNVLRIVRTPTLTGDATTARVVDASPARMSIEGFLGWGNTNEAVLTGLRAESGPIEQAVVLALQDNTLSSYMLFPGLGRNWVGVSTVSVATDLLSAPSEDYAQPTRPWSPLAKLMLCLLLAVFPTLYYLIARRPKH
jgi:hypothetical protein